MISLATPKPFSFFPPSSPPLPHKHFSTLITCSSNSQRSQMNLILPRSNSSTPVAPQPQNLYQPYRPPQSPLPTQYNNLDILSIIEVLSNRLGFWWEYAPLISNLFRDGFTPPSIEELTGISGVEQNRLVVAAQVRQSIAEDPEVDNDVLSFFDSGGSEILYELRLLSGRQRAAAAAYVVSNKLDGDKAKEIAKSIKDHPGRQDEVGVENFNYGSPGDCWAFTYVRLAREYEVNSDKRMTALETAMQVVQTDRAREYVKEEMEGKGQKEDEREMETAVKVPVVRLQMGEVAEATTVVVLPVSQAKEGSEGVERVPRECKSTGHFGVVVADKAWDRWVVLPKWNPVVGIGSGGVAVSFPNATVLPWRVNRSYMEEPILIIADRERRAIEFDDGFYLVSLSTGGAEGGLKVVEGSALKEMGVTQTLGTVVIVVRPPRDEDDQLNDEDWD